MNTELAQDTRDTELQIACRSCSGPTLDPGNGEAWCRRLHCPEGWGAVDHREVST